MPNRFWQFMMYSSFIHLRFRAAQSPDVESLRDSRVIRFYMGNSVKTPVAWICFGPSRGLRDAKNGWELEGLFIGTSGYEADLISLDNPELQEPEEKPQL